MFHRVMLQTGCNLPAGAGPGSGILNPNIITSPDAAYTLTVPDIMSGVVLGTLTGGARNYTLPSKVALDAANPNMNPGDKTIWFLKGTTNAITLVAGTNHTITGAVQIAGVMSLCITQKLADGTYNTTAVPMAAS